MDKNRVGEEAAAMLKGIAAKNGVGTRQAPIWVHKAIDGLMADDRHLERKAPQWVHDVVDFIWDLLF